MNLLFGEVAATVSECSYSEAGDAEPPVRSTEKSEIYSEIEDTAPKEEKTA